MKPKHFLLKALQAAIALEGREIEFRLGLSWVQLDFRLGHQASVEAQSLASYLAGEIPPDRGSHHLTMALKATLETEAPRVEWSLDKENVLRLEEGETEVHGPRLRGGAVQARLRVWRLNPLGDRGKKVIRAGEHRLLYEGARYCPEPVTLDGREIERGWPREVQPEGDWFDYMSYPYYLMEGYLLDPRHKLPEFRFPEVSLRGFRAEGGSWVSADLEEREGSLHLRDTLAIPATGLLPQPTLCSFFHGGVEAKPNRVLEEVNCQAAFALPLKLTGPGRLVFVLDGVSSRPKAVDLGLPGLLCVASGGGLEVDAGEFTVLENDAYQTRLEQLRGLAQNFREQVLGQRKLYQVLATDGLTRQALGSRIYAEDIRAGIEARLKL